MSESQSQMKYSRSRSFWDIHSSGPSGNTSTYSLHPQPTSSISYVHDCAHFTKPFYLWLSRETSYHGEGYCFSVVPLHSSWSNITLGEANFLSWWHPHISHVKFLSKVFSQVYTPKQISMISWRAIGTFQKINTKQGFLEDFSDNIVKESMLSLFATCQTLEFSNHFCLYYSTGSSTIWIRSITGTWFNGSFVRALFHQHPSSHPLCFFWSLWRVLDRLAICEYSSFPSPSLIMENVLLLVALAYRLCSS